MNYSTLAVQYCDGHPGEVKDYKEIIKKENEARDTLPHLYRAVLAMIYQEFLVQQQELYLA